MKHLIIAAAILVTIFCTATAYARNPFGRSYSYGYGSTYGRSYSSGSYGQNNYYSPAPQRSYNHGGEIYMQNGYSRSNGTYVMPHVKTRPDNYKWNNFGAWGR